MIIKPVGERVVIKQLKPGDKKLKSDDKKEGKVVAVGQYHDGKELPLKPGELVIYTCYNSEDIEINDVKYIIVDFKDIIAKIK